MPRTRTPTVRSDLKVWEPRHLAGVFAKPDVLAELLCPLKHPSALSTHPTLSDGFHSKALPDMVQDTALRLRQEKANLWRSKNLNRELLGDEAWFPCAAVESAEDWNIFTPRKQIFEGKESKKRKRNNNVPVGGIAARSSASPNDKVFETNSATPLNNKESRGKSPTYINGHSTSEVVAMTNAEDVNKSSLQRTDLSGREMESAHASDVDGTADLSLREAAPEPELDPILAANDTNSQGREREEVNEHSASEQTGCKAQDAAETVDMHEESKADQNCELRSEHSETSPPPPSRRITRALAATNILNSHLIAPTPPLSPAPTSSSSSSASMLQIDPLFLLPPSVHPPDSTSIYYGLPPEEALETRRLLTSYIQKQEESVRGYESVLSKLLKAQRLRSEVLEMCKAEGHVGEMSDGEDWIDYEQWDLQPGELLKGRDEDEDAVEENTIGGRKGKRRARN